MNTATELRHDTPSSSPCCPACEITPFARNNYFTGKLMLERDFTDEQRYHIDKLRLHNQRLHGWGVVCGLQVLADTNPACRDRFVTVQPGMAIDCCGHEIVATEPTRVDITRLPSYAAMTAAGAPKPRTLQMCIRYRECGTETIPVLYDDCAWDNDRCASNRIAESFEFDLLGPDEDPVHGGHTHVVTLGLVRTIGINRATRMAAHADSDRLYIATAPMNGASSGDLFQLTLGTEAIRTAADLEGEVAALGVSPKGTRVYVLRGDDHTPPGAVVDMYDAAAIDEAPVDSRPLDVSLGDHAGLAVTPAGVVVVLADGKLIELGPSLAPLSSVPSPGSRCIAAALKDERVYVGADAGEVASVDCAVPALPVIHMLTLTGSPDVLDIAVIPGPPDGGGAPTDELVALTHAPSVVLVSAGAELGTVTVDATATQLAVAADGRRAVVAGTAGAQIVNLLQLRTGSASVRTPFAVGAGVTGGRGDVLVGPDYAYVAYPGDTNDPGGVAVLGTVGLLDCDDLLWKSSLTCPSCQDPGCIVLATLLDYDVGDRLVDKGTAVTGASEVEIDNRLGRRLLPSTQTLTELIECLLNRPGGTGRDGIDGDQGPAGNDGEGLEKGLVRISGVSWIHGGTAPQPPIEIVDSQGNLVGLGFAIGFTEAVRTDNLDDNIFRVRVEHQPDDDRRLFRCRCDLRGRVEPIDPKFDPAGRITFGTTLPSGSPAKAVAFVVDRERFLGLLGAGQIDTLIELHGDFVLDIHDPPRAIDAEFVRAEFDTGDHPAASEFGIQGGLFESWFWLGSDLPLPDIGRVNIADRQALESVPGIGRTLSARILEERAAAPFTDADDFRARVKPSDRLWGLMRDHLDFTPPEA